MDRLPSGDERRRRHAGIDTPPAPADRRPIPPGPPAPPADPRPRPEPTPRGAEPIRAEPAPAATILTAAQLQADKIDEAAARANRVDKGDMLGWWRRKFYVVGNAAFGSVVGLSAGSLAAKALAGTAIAATLPSWAIGAAAAIPTVMVARYLLGLNRVDRMAKAGRVADKLKRQTRKAEKHAARAGGSFTMSDAALAERAQNLSNRVSWGTIAAGVGAGWLTGAIAYEIHTPGPNPVTDTVRGGARSVWERVSSGDWWYQKASGVWNALFGSATPSEAPSARVPAVAAPAPVHVAACDVAIREALAPFTDALSTYATRLEGLEDKIAALERAATESGTQLRLSGERIAGLHAEVARLTEALRNAGEMPLQNRYAC